MSNSVPLLELRDVRKHYEQGKNQVKALQGVTFSVPCGSFTCIMGRSGSGKTTLLNCIGALDRVTDGKILLEGEEIENLSERSLLEIRRRSFGFIFQESFLLPYLSSLDNVALPLVYRGNRWKEARSHARKLLLEIGLSQKLGQPARWLSGGEAQRVSIARSLIFEPRILLADEPTGELDTVTSKEILDLLCLQKKQGMTLIVATHDPSIVEKADIVLRLVDGKLAA